MTRMGRAANLSSHEPRKRTSSEGGTVSALAEMVVAPAHDEARARTNIRPERRPTRFPIEHRAVLPLATADDVATGMTSVVALIRHASRAAGVEWWAPGEDGALELAASAGESHGRREDIPLGPGLIAVFGGRVDP